MTTLEMTHAQIRTAGLRALARELGPVGMIRFLQQFERGSGDYTLERREWVESLTLDAFRERQGKHSPGAAE